MNENEKKISEEIKINFNDDAFQRTYSRKKIQLMTNHLNCEQRLEIDELTSSNNSIFAKDFDIDTVKDYEAQIDLSVDKYCRKRPYRATIED